MAHNDVTAANKHLIEQEQKLKALFGTMNPSAGRLKEWKDGLDEVQTNLKKFDAAHANDAIVKNGAAERRGLIDVYIKRCIKTYEDKSGVTYKFEYKEEKTSDAPPVSKTPTNDKKEQANPATATSNAPEGMTAEQKKNFGEGDALAKPLVDGAPEAGRNTVKGGKKVWDAVKKVWNDVKDGASDLVDGDKDKKPESAAATNATMTDEEKKKEAEAKKAKEKEKESGKKGNFWDDLPIGDILGALAGGFGGWTLGSMFGGGMLGTIIGGALAIGGALLGKQQFGGTIDGWIGRKNGSGAGKEKGGVAQSQQVQKEGAGQGNATDPSKQCDADKSKVETQDAYAIYKAQLEKTAQESANYVYSNPAMDPSPTPLPQANLRQHAPRQPRVQRF